METSQEQNARSEALFREVNERIAALPKDFSAGEEIAIVCECGENGCIEPLRVPHDVYEAVRTNPRWFFVAPGHQDDEVEVTFTSFAGYTIVEKIGAAGRIARETSLRH